LLFSDPLVLAHLRFQKISSQPRAPATENYGWEIRLQRKITSNLGLHFLEIEDKQLGEEVDDKQPIIWLLRDVVVNQHEALKL
jgi:hypothetical protein